MSRQEAMRRLTGVNPISTDAVSTLVPAAQRADLLERIVRVPPEPRTHGADVTQRAEDMSPKGAPKHARAGLSTGAIRGWLPSRRSLVLLGFVAAAILAGAAYAVVHELIVGSPAPLEVREQPARFGHSAELIPVPHPADPRLDEARVAAVLDSSVGTVYLFSSPDGRGGLCGSTWIEGDRGYQGRLNLSGVCGTSDQSFFSFGSQKYQGKSVRLFSGHARDGVASVAVRFGDKTVDVPLTDGWFLAEFPKQPDEFLSYDAQGRVLEQHLFPSPNRPRPHFVQPPHQVTQAREIAHLTTEDGSEPITLFVARASDGGYCRIVRSDQRPSNGGCSNPPPQPSEIGVDAMNFGGAPGGVLLLVGRVGSELSPFRRARGLTPFTSG